MTSLLDKQKRKKLKYYFQGVTGFLIACLVFLPWQFYISLRFPLESQWEYSFNTKHFFEALEGHGHSFGYYFENLDDFYTGEIAYLLIVGLILSLADQKYRIQSLPLLSMTLLFYLFFSMAATKMPAFVLPVSFFILGLAALAITHIAKLFEKYIAKWMGMISFLLAISVIGYLNLNINEILEFRSKDNRLRYLQIENAKVFKEIGDELKEVDLVFNLNTFEEVKLMFYQDVAAYSWYPSEKKIDSLVQEGVKLATFKQQKGGGPLYKYMLDTQNVKQLSLGIYHLE